MRSVSLAIVFCTIVAAQGQPPAATTPISGYRLIHARTGREVSLEQLAGELASRGIVYFGEVHDNEKGHQVYAELARRLAERRPDTVLSLEMFERDVQGVVNDYLRGRIDEATFLKHSRPWKNYTRDYKPLIELARERKLDVIAGNLPRPVAARVASKEGSTSLFLPRTTTAPNDRYFELFAEQMKGHPGAEGAVDRMYRAQCAKDDAMAESIAEYLMSNPHRQPMVIQCNGNFHSDYGLGTAARVMQRVPLTEPAIISMVEAADVAKADLEPHRRKGHYLLIVPAPPRPPQTAMKTPPKGESKPPSAEKGVKPPEKK